MPAPAARPGPRRAGATIVEVALLLSIFLMFLFGILEYARYILMLQMATNAARDGARYAAVNVGQASNFDTVDSTQTDSYGNPLGSVTKYTTARMGGVQGMIAGFTVTVFPCDTTAAGLYANPPVIQTKTTATNNGNTVYWNSAVFTERIAVRITGTYNPILPNFLWMQNTAAVNVVALSGSEG